MCRETFTSRQTIEPFHTSEVTVDQHAGASVADFIEMVVYRQSAGYGILPATHANSNDSVLGQHGLDFRGKCNSAPFKVKQGRLRRHDVGNRDKTAHEQPP